MMRYSSPSILMSWPEYFPKRIVSPSLTSSPTRSFFSFLPRPTAMTLPCCGFSLAVSGMMIPPIFCSPSSMRCTMMRSWSGLTFMLDSVWCEESVDLRVSSRAERLLNICGLVGTVNGGVLRIARRLKSPLARPFPQLVRTHLAGQRVPVHAERARSLRQAAVAAPQHPRDESLFELANGIVELDPSVDHFLDEFLEAIANHADARRHGDRSLQLPTGQPPISLDVFVPGFRDDVIRQGRHWRVFVPPDRRGGVAGRPLVEARLDPTRHG